MAWQALLLFHVAVLPWCSGWAASPRRPRRAPWVTRGMALYLGLAVLLTLGFAFATPNYRCGGTEGLDLALRSDHPMLTSSRSWRPVRSP